MVFFKSSDIANFLTFLRESHSTRTKMSVRVVNLLEYLCTFRYTGFPRAFVSVKEWFPLCEITDLVMNHHVQHDFSIVYRVNMIYRIFHLWNTIFFKPDFLSLAVFMAGILPKCGISFQRMVYG